MKEQEKSLIYLGPDGSFSHEVSLSIKANHPTYSDVELKPVSTIADVCQMVIEGKASYGLVPIENSVDGLVNDGLEGFRKYPLWIGMEYVHPISQSLYYQSGVNLEDVKRVISKDSALGQCKRKISQLLPWAILEPRPSTVAAILEAAREPQAAAIGPRMAGEVQGLSDILIRIDNIHDNPLNATRFFLVDSQNTETPITGSDKTSLIVQIPDVVGGLFTVLDALGQQGINLTKIKSFGRSGNRVAFFMSVQGHQRELSLNSALGQLSLDGVRVKMLGSYPQSTYQLPEINWELDMEYAIERLRENVTNGIRYEDKTVVVFTLEDKVGALRDTLKPFAVRRINLTEIDSLPTGRLDEYIFWLSFDNGVSQRNKAIDELAAHCKRLVLLENKSLLLTK